MKSSLSSLLVSRLTLVSIFAVFLFFSNFFEFVSNSGKFEIRVNSSTKTSKLFLCLKEVQKSSEIRRNVCTLGSSLALHSNSAEIKFTFRWTNEFSLFLEINENSFELNEEKNARPENRWKARELGPDLRLEFRVSCDSNYHRNDCATFCRPRDDTYGHYSCDSFGRKVCEIGWKEENCDKPKCREKCNENHGFCYEPNECQCRNGWKGEHCDQCVEYPGCLHGYCLSPFQCICLRNWGGILCSEDLNYCGTHAPCLNAGQCANIAPNHYKCECRQGFTGVNCQTIVDSCATHPCLHGGQCRSLDNGREFQCECSQGRQGNRCERDVNECLSEPCLNGGICHDLHNDFKCQCLRGWNGSRCEQDIDECANDPCVHASKCINTRGDFHCQCHQGFEGKHCETEVNDCQKVFCQNGGKCLDLLNDFRCVCNQPFSGQLCQSLDQNICRKSEQNIWRLENSTKVCFCSEKALICSQSLNYSRNYCSFDTKLVFSESQDNICDTLMTVNAFLSKEEDFCCSEDSLNSVSITMTSSLRSKVKNFPNLLKIETKTGNSFVFYGISLISVFILLIFVFLFFKHRRNRSKRSEEIVFNCIQNNLNSNLRKSNNFLEK